MSGIEGSSILESNRFTADPRYKPVVHTKNPGGKDKGIEGFLIDIQTRIWSNIKQSGFELYVQSFDGEYHNFYIAFDPYFYVIVDDFARNGERVMGQLRAKCVNERGWEMIRKDGIQVQTKHVCGEFHDLFYCPQRVIKVTTYYPFQVSSKKKTCCSKIAKKIRDVLDVREYDVPFHWRGMIDLDLNVGKAYRFKVEDGFVYEYEHMEMDKLPELPSCSFDIEVKKKPVKKPQIGDPVNMFGYKYIDDGFMINNLNIHRVPIEGFWLGVKDGNVSPITEEEARKQEKIGKYKPVYFTPLNVKNEREVLLKWREFIVEKLPKIVGGYFSDRFDWNQIIENGKLHDPPVTFDDLFDLDNFEKAWKRDGHIMIDAFKFVERDSYLSKGNRGLKDVSKILLGIEPLEIDHEETARLLNKIHDKWTNPDSDEYDMEKARKEVQNLAYYCASDVYITSILIDEHVADLDIGLATILPLNVFETARKRRGPMVEAMLLKRLRSLGMIAPNKVKSHGKRTFNPLKSCNMGKDVFQEYKRGEDKLMARCVDKRWKRDNCKGCSRYSTCREVLSTKPLHDNKRFYCEKHDEEMFLAPDANLPVDKYKFKGAYVKAFKAGVFKDNCKIKFEIDSANLDHVQKKMKIILLKKINKIKQDGFKIKNLDACMKEIDDGFQKIREKCKQMEDGNLFYEGLILIVHIDVSSMYPSIIINYNLQPHGVVNDLICETCPLHHAEDEPCCWVDLPWNAMYNILMLPPELKKKIDGSMDVMKKTPEEMFKIYDDAYNNAVKNGTIEKVRKKFNTYTEPMTARFCQKAHKTFVNMVIDFRNERYKYKRGEKKLRSEIEKKREVWKERMPEDLVKRREKLERELVSVKEEIVRLLEQEEIEKHEIKKVVKRSKDIRKEIKEIVGEWMGQIPPELKKKINALEIKQTYNRNAQLTYKVILNAIYGWLKSTGARLWSIEVTGCTTMMGQKIIKWVVDYTNGFTVPIELDSLDYSERLIFRNPSGLIKVLPIGKFVDLCFDENGFERIDQRRSVEYANASRGWKVLSVDNKGNVSWEKIKMGIRQKTDRNILEVKTPLGKAKVTPSHSIYHNNNGKIEPFEVGKMKDEKITHVSTIPPVEFKNQKINLLHSLNEFKFNVYIFIPVNEKNKEKWGKYPVSNLRESKYSTRRVKYYKVPSADIGEEPKEEWLMGAIKGNKFSPIVILDEDLAELAGWYVAEGSKGLWNGDIGAGISQQKGENLTKIVNLARNIGRNVRNYEPHASLGDIKSNTYRVGMDNLYFYLLFTALGCGGKSSEKRIPSIILSSERKIKDAFLRGYINGDGFHHKDGSIRCGTISDGLRDDLYVLGGQMGYTIICRNITTPKGDPFYEMRLTTVERIKKSPIYARAECIGNTIGLKAKSVKEIKKSTDYVYDLSVDNTHKFVGANGGIVFSNTDGCWSAIPVDLPLEITIIAVDDNGNEKSFALNLFNGIVNNDVKADFTNHNNYVYDEEKDEYINVPQCLIEFDYDGPYSTFFVQREKRYTAKERDPEDPTSQKVSEVKGMDQKRKGELPVIKELEKNVDKCYEEGNNYNEVYGYAVDVAIEFIDDVKNKKLDPEMIYESRDIKEVNKPIKAYSLLKTLEMNKEYDMNSIPMCPDIIKNSSLKKEVKKKIAKAIGSKDNKSLNNRQNFGCMRLIDLGVDVEDGETVQWIVSKFPKSVKAVSPRVVPTIVFDAPDDEMRKYLKRWIGISAPPNANRNKLVRNIIDWDYYLERIGKKIMNILVIPWEKQKELTSGGISYQMEKVKERLGFHEEGREGLDLFNMAKTMEKTSKPVEKEKVVQSVTSKVTSKKKTSIDLKDFL